MEIKYYEHSRRSKPPFETINKIKTIISSLNIFTFEENNDFSRNDFFSCSIYLGENDLYKIPIISNGKGISLAYAFASGFAEFMERLQNNFLYHKILLRYGEKLKNKIKYKYAPDEININYKKCIKKNKWLKEFFNYKELKVYFEPFLTKNEEVTCLPFYSINSNKVVNLPADFIYFNSGSNGMASGNTIEEALLQGLCEIFERYSMRTIYFNRISPPTIPKIKFKGYDIYEKINSFEEKYKKKIIVKDCSLGKNLPVLAVVMIDQNDYSYAVNFGSDPSPILALERCMSELMQGDYKYKTNSFRNNKIKKGSRYELYNYHKIFTSNSGVWPETFFSTQESYKFSEFDLIFDNSNHYKPLLQKINNLGHQVFVRNVSYFGFPTVHIYVPGLSEYNPKLNQQGSKIIKNYNFIVSILKDIQNSNLPNERTLEIIKSLEIISSSTLSLSTNLKDILLFNYSKELEEVNLALLLFWLSYRINDYQRALKYFSAYTKSQKIKHIYYYCAYEYIKLRSQKNPKSRIRQKLLLIFEDKLVDEVMNDFSNPKNIHKYFSLPNCFECNKCKLKNYCLLEPIIDFDSRLHNLKENNLVKQHELNHFFKDITL